MSRRFNLALVVSFGAACSLAGWTAAQAGESAILKPKSTEAIALPARPDAPANCDEAHAGWIYLDTEVGDGVYPCACIKTNQKVWDWIVIGAMPGKMCE